MSKSNVYFFYQVAVTLRARTRLKRFIREIFKKEGKKLNGINYIFCTDAQLLKINKEFLNHDSYTDIITFRLSQGNSPIEAEIYISTERVRDNAKQLGHSFKNELHRVIFHGVLHLCGYKDKTTIEMKRMREREDHYLNMLQAWK